MKEKPRPSWSEVSGNVHVFCGIDPGQSGGIAFIPTKGEAWAHKMPDTDMEILDILRGAMEKGAVSAHLELVHSMPKQGVASSFKFGEGYGRLQMALAALSIPYTKVTPQRWQKEAMCLSKGNKNITKIRAQQLFPHIKVTHALADALLIAYYGAKLSRDNPIR